MSPRSPITATVPCRACDTEISAVAEICPHCGVRQFDPHAPATAVASASERRILPAALLCFFFGVFGAHRFYVGKTGTAVIQLLTLGGLGIWAMIDLVVILLGQFRDDHGRPLTQWT